MLSQEREREDSDELNENVLFNGCNVLHSKNTVINELTGLRLSVKEKE